MRAHVRGLIFALAAGAVSAVLAPSAAAQSLGAFRWQFQPYCNVVTLQVTQVGSVYRLEGFDDQCGAGRDQASAVGTAFLNPDGSIGFGLTIVAVPGGAPVHVEAAIALSTLSGTWHDVSGATGAFVLTPGAPAPGYPRALPGPLVPPAIRLNADGGLVASAEGAGGIPANGEGSRMMWYAGKAAFRAGHVSANGWDDAQTGRYSVAFGLDSQGYGQASAAFGMDTRATGAQSAAFGDSTIASGENSLAMGYETTAVAPNALAAGLQTHANAAHSQAFGQYSTATGLSSMAINNGSQAIGAYSFAGGDGGVARGYGSVAFGHAEVLANATGSFAFGDNSTPSRIVADIPGQFKVRASGGVRFATNGAETAGVQMVGGSSQWLQLSDVHSKHRFTDLNGEDVLRRIAVLPVMEWSYLAQEDGIRHIGPTAQDFHAAFGLGEDERYIGSLDADGVALAGVKALEARTRVMQDTAGAMALGNASLRDDHATLASENARLREELDALRARIDRLEAALERKR
ncbi:MAG: hypothetical protein R2712_09385 [Vicinamibacterales bacterium]